MATSRNGRETSGFKTLAIRLDDELHARLSVIAQLEGSTITEEIREAIESHIERKRVSGELSERAGSVLEEIEREAATRRSAIAALFGQTAEEPTSAEPSRRRSRSKGEEVS